MEAIEGLIQGFQVAMLAENLLAALIGAALGTAVGVLPGLGPLGGAALVLPFTYSMEPTAAIIMIAGIYYGGMYGGSTTSVLLNVPGETASVVTTLDGYPLTQKGRAGPTLFIMAIGSAVAAFISLVLLTFFSPWLARFGLRFGPAEFFAVMTCGLIVLSRVSGGSLMSNLFPLMIGIVAGTVGQEAVSSAVRFTFGYFPLIAGLELVALAIGLFGLAEVLRLVENPAGTPRVKTVRVRDMVPSREEFSRSVGPWGRGSLVGFVFGLLPGPSAAMSSYASYQLEKKVARGRAEMGKGAIEGVAGPEAANNAAATSGMIPVLSLGLPFSATLALILAALMIHGIQPGPLLPIQHPDIFWGVIASMFVGNIMLLMLNIPMIGVWVSMLKVPIWLLGAIVIVIAVVGTFAARNNLTDVYVLTGAAAAGYFLHKLGFNLAPLILGFVLGPEIEKHLRQGLYLSNGDLTYFIERPIAATLWGITILTFLVVFLWRRFFGERARELDAIESGDDE
ncbi:tripartite tricarboxylate transporter permease [Roseitranquillus sediminis]|uniref:tripartite tricarboxylate transporter permease n=1 Tax=Roseitranquillus sediminis TaxID=2809051 RepID=UPI001D0BFF66|nr:tripartite tricarboxylate transporter permease [Roseitranquillus sediminis]MBM9593160.1 tripartite tricarboxylate transporter permease [Roseitranquillus sediminis]